MLLSIFASKLKGIIGKWLASKLYLKTGYNADISILAVELNEKDERVTAHLEIDLTMTSNEFYRMLEELAK